MANTKTQQQQQQEEPSSSSSSNKDIAYIKTAVHSYISREAYVYGVRSIKLQGKSIISPHVHIRGDFHDSPIIRIGRYCYIGVGTTVRPSFIVDSVSTNIQQQEEKDKLPVAKYVPLLIGNNTCIDSNCVIESAWIGSSVYVAPNCILGKRCIIKDNCYIEQDTVIPADTVIPPFSIVRGCPGTIVGQVPESFAVEMMERSVYRYTDFVKRLVESEEEK